MKMSDINCPYCDLTQEINHDDGYGYQEDEIYQQECSDCGKTFTFTTSISLYYDVEKAACLNGSKCEYKPTVTYPKSFTRMECAMCGDRRTPTESEMRDILKEKI